MEDQNETKDNRVTVYLPPEDRAIVDALAARVALPGTEPNRSAALRHIIRTWAKLDHALTGKDITQ